MNFLLLLAFTFCTFINGDEENEKYIDLLPDAEKQAFLEQVAKRLINEVTYKVNQENASREITNVELDQQDDFVNKVLEEESNSLRRRKEEKPEVRSDHAKDKSVTKNKKPFMDLTLRTNKWQQKGSINPENELKIPVKTVYDTDDEFHKVKNKNSEQTLIKNRDQMSDDDDIQARGIRRNRKELMKDQSKILRTEEKEEQITHIILQNGHKTTTLKSKPILKTNKEKFESDSVLDRTDTITDHDNKSPQEINDYTKTTEHPTFSGKSSKHTVTVRSESTLNTSIIVKNTSNNIKSNIPQQQNKTSVKHKRVLRNSSNVTERSQYKIKANDTHNFMQNETGNSNTLSLENKNVSTTQVKLKNNLQNKTEYTIKSPSANQNIHFAKNDTSNNNNVSAPSFKKQEEMLNVLTTAKPYIDKHLKDVSSTLANSTISPVSSNMTNYHVNVKDDLATTTTTTKLIDDIEKSVTREDSLSDKHLNVLRQGINYQNSDGKHNYEQSKHSQTYKEYAVYEISAEKTAFHEQNYKVLTTPSPEQPHYAPVYNYEPENAYFNAYNRLGPNGARDKNIFGRYEYDDERKNSDGTSEITDTLEKSYLRKFKFKKKSSNKARPSLKANNYAHRLSVVKSPKLSDVYLNPNDYLDLDYYFGRMGKPRNIKYNDWRKKKDNDLKHFILDSDNEEDPINTHNYSTKSYLSDVRKLLLKHKMYDHIPERNAEKRYKNRNIGTVPEKELPYSFIPDDDMDDISMDYYYSANKNWIAKLLRQVRNEKSKIPTKQTPTEFATKVKKYKKDKIKNSGTLMELLKIGDPTEFLKYLDTMLSLNMTSDRDIKNELELEPFLGVLRDMIKIDNEALVHFDWLGTAVDINAAVEKLFTLSEAIKKMRKIHRADLNLIKYVQYLYFTSKETIESQDLAREKNPSFNKAKLQRKQSKQKNNNLKRQRLIQKVWLYLRGRSEDKEREEINMIRLNEIQMFLNDLRNQLFNLHSAMKEISKSTSYNKWYAKLKDVYLKNAPKRRLLEVLLHIRTTRLFDLIEEKAKNGLEDDLTNNEFVDQDDVKETIEEFVFILMLLEKLKSVDE